MYLFQLRVYQIALRFGLSFIGAVFIGAVFFSLPGVFSSLCLSLLRAFQMARSPGFSTLYRMAPGFSLSAFGGASISFGGAPLTAFPVRTIALAIYGELSMFFFGKIGLGVNFRGCATFVPMVRNRSRGSSCCSSERNGYGSIDFPTLRSEPCEPNHETRTVQTQTRELNRENRTLANRVQTVKTEQ